MEVQTVSMNPSIARVHYLEYRARVKQHRAERLEKTKSALTDAGRELRRVRSVRSKLEREDTELMKAYQAMSLGQRVLSLPSVLASAGVGGPHYLPKLAVAHADWEWCHLWRSPQSYFFSIREWDSRNDFSISVPLQTFPAELTNTGWRAQNNHPNSNIRALVPSVPPHLRPAGNLGDYCILWEANWEFKAPVDPLLLKHIEGGMYSVLAQWDTTPLERMVLEGRLR